MADLSGRSPQCANVPTTRATGIDHACGRNPQCRELHQRSCSSGNRAARIARACSLRSSPWRRWERDRTWKGWQSKFDQFKTQAEAWHRRWSTSTNPSAPPSAPRKPTPDLNQKLERRINEITEIQRLADDRIRQEWVTFKADDQKRWTGLHPLAGRMRSGPAPGRLEKLKHRITASTMSPRPCRTSCTRPPKPPRRSCRN